ncbi:MAG: NUDIX domain-containing protein [Acidobacteria bacterium]|nr:NUDIX domain-containing protein [Acidobacteriota bacterium]
MPHLNYYLDWTVSVFIIFEAQVLLVDHKQLKKWLPVGGHIDPGEDPEHAAHREVEEESGLSIELVGERLPDGFEGTRPLVAPAYLDVHHIAGEHHHLGMIYFARAATGAIRLAPDEHNDIRWFNAEDLESSTLTIPDAVRFYGKEAIRRLATI